MADKKRSPLIGAMYLITFAVGVIVCLKLLTRISNFSLPHTSATASASTSSDSATLPEAEVEADVQDVSQLLSDLDGRFQQLLGDISKGQTQPSSLADVSATVISVAALDRTAQWLENEREHLKPERSKWVARELDNLRRDYQEFREKLIRLGHRQIYQER